MIRAATALIVLLFTAEVRSETVDVKYRGPVDLKTFECRDINRSSFFQRVCYSPELHDHKFEGRKLSLLRIAIRDVRRLDGCFIHGPVL
jgi:hypothetical protein